MDGDYKMENPFFQRLFWLLSGVIFGVIAGLMAVSGSTDLNRFYDGGRVCDILADFRNGDVSGMEYRPEEDRFVVTAEDAYKVFTVSDKAQEWNYIRMDLSQAHGAGIHTVFEYYTPAGEMVAAEEVVLTGGRNEIRTEGLSYSGLIIRVRGQVGAAFLFDKVQFREKEIKFAPGRFARVWGIAFLFYTGISLLIKKLWRKSGLRLPEWYAVIDFLQGIYQMAGESAGCMVSCRAGRWRSRLRTSAFLFLILYMQVITDLKLYETNRYYKVHMLVCSISVIFIGVLCYEGKLKKRNWRNPLVRAWTVLWLMACASDFFVAKRYSFSGYVMLLVVGFFFFQWNNMEKKEEIVREFVNAVLLSFVVTTVFCFLCRPLAEGARYLGSYYSPGMYAMYLLFVWAAFWGDIDYRLGKKMSSPLLWAEVAGAVLSGVLLWKTQSSSGVIPAALVLAVFVLKRFYMRGPAGGKRRTLLVFLAAAVLVVPVSLAGTWGLTHLPGILGTEVRFQSDEVFTTTADLDLWETIFGPVHVYAAGEIPGNVMQQEMLSVEEMPAGGAPESDQPADEMSAGMQPADSPKKGGFSDSRILKKLFGKHSFEDFTSARNYYWLGYLRETNLLGHENKVKLWGKNRWPHNGFIAFLYRYGIFSLIPYTIMVFMNLVCAWKYMLAHRNGYGYYLFADMLAAFILILMENLELPFLFLCWMGMYLMMGIYFEQDGESNGNAGIEKRKCRKVPWKKVQI